MYDEPGPLSKAEWLFAGLVVLLYITGMACLYVLVSTLV